MSDSFKRKLGLSSGHIRIQRASIFSDAISTYSTKPKLTNQFPLAVRFEGEEGVDFGGLCRDFFSGFWEEAYMKLFDGAALLTPVCHADVDVSQFAVLGQILSHGYLCCGFLPTRIAFPVLAFVLLGLSATISQETMVNSLSDFLCQVDRKTMAESLKAKAFTPAMKTNLINILARFGCRDMPTPQNLGHLVYVVAQHQFRLLPFAAISTINSGIPDKHRPFWQSMDVDDLYHICDALTVSPEKVLEVIEEPEFLNPSEERVFVYLQQYIGEMKVDEAKRFLRFVTGSSVVTGNNITVCFNGLTGASRRPIAHTCSNQLDLPYSYTTFLEFVDEFTTLLRNDEFCWPITNI